jgi:hypothetical protein
MLAPVRPCQLYRTVYTFGYEYPVVGIFPHSNTLPLSAQIQRFTPTAVTGAPYSATQTPEHIQTLADGTHIIKPRQNDSVSRDSARMAGKEMPPAFTERPSWRAYWGRTIVFFEAGLLFVGCRLVVILVVRRFSWTVRSGGAALFQVEAVAFAEEMKLYIKHGKCVLRVFFGHVSASYRAAIDHIYSPRPDHGETNACLDQDSRILVNADA